MTDLSRYVLYPRYINATAKKSDGRRIGLEFCPPNPTVKVMAEHLRRLYPDSEVIVEENKRYPRSAVEAHDIGRIKIEKKNIAKQEILKQLAQSILRERPKAPAA